LCLYKKTLAKNRSLDGKIIPSARIDDFLKRTRSIYGEDVYLAFRLGLNAMLRVQEISALKIVSFRGDAKPLPQVDVLALKKKVELKYAVDVDPRMATDIGKLTDGRPTSESLFGMPVRTLQHKFKQIVRGMDLGHLSIHSLRHTGISNRARAIANMNDLNYLRQQARHESIETTKLYMGYEERQRVEMAKIVKWF
jgi:integrase